RRLGGEAAEARADGGTQPRRPLPRHAHPEGRQDHQLVVADAFAAAGHLRGHRCLGVPPALSSLRGAGNPVKNLIGEALPRLEDPVLLRGEGRYTDDVNEPNQAYAYIVRSSHAHGLLKKIDFQKAKAMPGVLAVYTAQDLAAYGPHKCALDFKMRDGSPMKRPVRKSLASDKVR